MIEEEKEEQGIRYRYTSDMVIEPMLCERLDPLNIENCLKNPDFIFETKYDGTRCIAIVDNQYGVYKLQNRRELDISQVFPEIVDAIQHIPCKRCILDGEIVVENPQTSRPDFNMLAQRAHLKDPFKIKLLAKRMPAKYYVFDILEIEDEEGLDNCESEPLMARKVVLSKLLSRRNAAMESAHWVASTESRHLLDSILAQNGEGVVAKRVNSTYQRSQRSKDWLKIKKHDTIDCIIVGYTLGEGRRFDTLGALVLAQYNKRGEMGYVGKVGTGFNDNFLEALKVKLSKMKLVANVKARTMPNSDLFPIETIFVRPELVCEVTFMERSPNGMLRHPVFVRLRNDKKPEDCVV